MSIVPMQRVTLCGLLGEKAAVLDELQSLGVMHLVPLSAPDPLTPDDPAMRRRAQTAFRHVMDAPEQLRPYRIGAPFHAAEVIGRIVANRLRLRELADRRDELDALIAGLAPWGDLVLPGPAEIGGERLWLYALPVAERAALDRLQLPWAIVGRTPTALQVAVIAPEQPLRSLLPVPPVETGGAPLSALRAEREELDISLEKAERERAELSRWRLLLGADLAAAQNADDRRAAAALTYDADAVFALQGWAPVEAGPALASLAEGRGLALLVEPPSPADAPPTLLRPGDARFAVGADLTSFYTSPGYRGWDPSLVVFVSFAVFFAMIVADAGYGLLLAGGAALYWRRMGASAAGRRMRTLLATLAGATLAYGIAAGSYFGFAPPAGGALAGLAFIDVTDFEKMMVVSVAIGAIHISIALGAVAWLNRGHGKSLAALGWIAVIAAGLLFWLGDGALARTVAIAGIVGGLAAVFWGNASARPIAKPSDRLMRLVDGALSLTGVTKLFGDLLSYLRLFALGLASASLAATFNQIALDIHAGWPGIGLLLAILVLVFGHAINIAIGLMSGVVHGLRLNYIEFFGWGLTEDGYPFRAFAKRDVPA